MFKEKIILLGLLLLAPVIIFTQVTGVVTEAISGKEQPLFSVNVHWKGTNVGTSTDENGRFSIPKPDDSEKLIFSFVGYVSDTLTITNPNQELEVSLRSGQVLDEVTVGGRRGSTFYSRLEPISTQTVTAEELCRSACCNLSESFETNASVDASFSDAVTGAKQIQLLGLSGKYVQMMTENIPNLYGLAEVYGLMYIPGTWMESIQISKGASAVINGYEGITGQINVEYKKPQSSERFFFNQFASTGGLLETNFNASTIINDKWSTMAFGHFGYSVLEMDHNHNGFLDEPLINKKIFYNRWDYYNNDITMRFGVKVLDENRSSGQVGHDHGDFSSNDNFYGINIDTRRLDAWHKVGYVFPEKEYQSIALVSDFVYHEQESYYGLTTYDASHTSAYLNLMWQSAFAGDLGHGYNMGATFKYENYDEYLNDSSILFNEVVPGAYFQYTANFIQDLNFIAGIRADHHNEFGMLYTPRLHLKYDINNHIIFRASAGKGFRYANVLAENSFLLASSRQIKIADDLRLEEAWNYGANLSFIFPVNNRDININLEFYRTEFINQIVADFEHARTVSFYNLDGESFSNVYQIETSYSPYDGVDITAAFRYNDVKQTIGGELMEAPLTNRFRGMLTGSYTTPKELFQFDLTRQFNGPGRIPSTEANPQEYRVSSTYDAFNIYNAQVTTYIRNFDIYLGVENILDFVQDSPIIAANDPFGDYFDSSLIWGPVLGRKFYLGIRYRIER